MKMGAPPSLSEGRFHPHLRPPHFVREAWVGVEGRHWVRDTPRASPGPTMRNGNWGGNTHMNKNLKRRKRLEGILAQIPENPENTENL